MKLKTVLTNVLEDHAALALDDDSDREELLKELMSALRSSYPDAFEDSDDEDDDAEDDHY